MITETQKRLFLAISNHLLAQGEKSLGQARTPFEDPVCAYRGENGTACAIGCIIPNDKYTSKIEGFAIQSQIMVDFMRAIYSDLTYDDLTLLNDLQSVHDNYPPGRWEERLLALWRAWNGTPNP